ncbi:MAG: response regulator [Reyranella sp.]|uniref:response regulator n=1 Tax=Reyranella sp. TaxID=1929291 RepID=UPI00121110D6|nr:response regulator [Reyranella sp.]TAJ95353.1 MAG: response regulator [Reyranella sp.]TBR25442.1 MAG: response regulator [Reyranella sp.]
MSKHVLIVEDDELVADHLAALVRDQLGCVPIVAGTAGEAMTLAAERVDFSFLDIKLSDGMTFALAKLLRARGVPFVFVSASDPAKVPRDLSEMPFLRKPVAAPRLLAAARQHL